MDSKKAAQEDLSEINDNRRFVVLESPPYKNAVHNSAKDGMMALIIGFSVDWCPWLKVVRPGRFFAFMLTCDNLHTCHCKSAKNYFVVPRPRWFPTLGCNI
jgi:hypothetical protein